MKLGFTGTQYNMTPEQRGEVADRIRRWGVTELHHGDCVGADNEAAIIAKRALIVTVGHPPTDNRKRSFFSSDESRPPKPYLDRNRDIVDETDVLLAAPRSPEQTRSGTWATIRYAVQQGKSVTIVYPSGSAERR